MIQIRYREETERRQRTLQKIQTRYAVLFYYIRQIHLSLRSMVIMTLKEHRKYRPVLRQVMENLEIKMELNLIVYLAFCDSQERSWAS